MNNLKVTSKTGQNNLKVINKKGNIPITILVIGVVAICILAIGSFLFSEIKLSENLNIGYFEDIHSDIEEFYFYINAGDNQEVAAEKIDAKINGEGRLEINKKVVGMTINYVHKIEIK